jgi:butyrate kinase
MGKRYEDCCFVVAHIDGGVTVNAHEQWGKWWMET